MSYKINFEIDFKRNKFPGKLIAIEGNEGSGKTTQVKRVVEELKKKGIDAIATKEPTTMPIGQFIRESILTGKVKVPAVSIQYLYCADRAMHQEEIEDYLRKGKTVVMDRYFWSSVAYAFADLEFDKDKYLTVLSVLSPYDQFIKPDLTFYLKVSQQEALGRIETSHKHKEIYDNEEKFPKIEEGYDYLMEIFPEEFVKINAEQKEEEIAREIIQEISKL